MKLVTLTSLALVLPVFSQSHRQQQFPLTAQTSELSIPLLGYGTWNLKPNASEAVSYALQSGYRHLDCAAAYGNEKEVGKGIADGLEKAGLDRSDIWVTSKLWNDHHDPDMVEEGLNQTLSDLGLDYLDLYLMHWPVGSYRSGNKFDYISTWHAMELLLETGKVRFIGVSNFSPRELSELIASSTVKPAAHQMELHPYLQQTAWVQWHHSQNIHVTAYSPLGNSNPTYDSALSKDAPPALLENEVMEAIAGDAGCTTAQVALKWGISRRTSVIPKSAHADRIKENFESLNCELEYMDFQDIEELGRKYLTRFNNPSKAWGVDLYEGLDGA